MAGPEPGRHALAGIVQAGFISGCHQVTGRGLRSTRRDRPSGSRSTASPSQLQQQALPERICRACRGARHYGLYALSGTGKGLFHREGFLGYRRQRERAFLVDGKALRLRETFELKDRSGAVVATVRKKLLAFRDSMDIERDGAVIAIVKKALVSPLHHRSVIELSGGGELEAVGNILDKEFEIRSNGSVLAQVSRSWFRVRDTYGVDVAPGQDDALMLAIAVCLDRIHHDEEERRRR